MSNFFAHGRQNDSSETVSNTVTVEFASGDTPLPPHGIGFVALPKKSSLDIEHAEVQEDPRLWSSSRKLVNLCIIALTAIAPTLGVNIYNRKRSFLSSPTIESQLHASSQDIALSLSVFIFVQGTAPLLWSAISEIVGRKIVYMSALVIYAIGCTVAALSRSIGVLISMRVLQAIGASVAFTLGSGVIADMYDTHERGARVGIFYAIPLLGPSLGPMLGGILVQAWNWRATFWIMVILATISILSFLCFKETFRRERSLAYQAAQKRASDRQHKSISITISPVDVEKGAQSCAPRLTLADVNPFGPARHVLKQRTNLSILFASGTLFGFSYGICYTCARTFAAAPYNYSALKVGAVLLSFGIGNLAGSILGGRWSDIILAQLKVTNHGVSQPEMRLRSTTVALIILPPFVMAYGWSCQYHIHVSAPVIALFIAGFALLWAYSSTLAYIVDSNIGRASSVTAMNSCFRGVFGLVVAEVSGPIQDRIGDGGLFSIWAGVLCGTAFLILITANFGETWRKTQLEHDSSSAVVAQESKN